MGNFAAVLVLIACPAGGSGCINEPVRVISYDSAFICKAQREEEIRKVRVAGFKIYGECNSINGDLLAGKPRIDIRRDVEKTGTKTHNNDASYPAPKRAFY